MTSVFFSQMIADLFADSRRNKDYTLMFCENQRKNQRISARNIYKTYKSRGKNNLAPKKHRFGINPKI
jgi:hypothetical protein